MDHHHHFGVLVIGFALAMIAVLSGFLTFHAPITGNIVATGGDITQVDISIGSSNIRWVGIYGNISSGGFSGSQEFSSGQVFAVNLYFNNSLNNTYVASSTNRNFSWDDLRGASFAEVDAYTGLSSGSAYSAENTLTFKHNFSIANSTHEVWSSQTNSLNGSYITGAFTDGRELSFITKVLDDNSYGFTNSPSHYQVLFPISAAGTANISFIVFNGGTLPLDPSTYCNVSANFSARLANDNTSVEVHWDAITGALAYDLLYLEGPSNGFLNFSSATSVPLGQNTSWTDSSPSDERYYRLRIHSNTGSCIDDETAGTLVVNVSPDFNMISTPFTFEDSSISEVLRPIDGWYNEIYEYDNEGKIYKYYIIVGETIFRTFNTITPGKGYWIKTFSDESLRLAGTLDGVITESVSPDFNLVSFPTISNNESDDSLSFVLNSIDGQYDEVYEYDNDGKIYKYYIIVGETVFRTFNTITPGKGYWIKTDASEVLTYAND